VLVAHLADRENDHLQSGRILMNQSAP